jgi:predicted PolB exonuclease-like 3'-5' exonuclease
MTVESSNSMQQMQQMQMRKMDGSGGGQGKGGGMKDIMSSLSSEDQTALKDQLSSMSMEDRMSMVSQMKEVDKSSMSDQEYAQTLLDILDQTSTNETQTEGFSVYA